jgi:hypothetical protein
MELYELLRKADGADVDFLREGVRTLAQALMEVETAGSPVKSPRARTPTRRSAIPAACASRYGSLDTHPATARYSSSPPFKPGPPPPALAGRSMMTVYGPAAPTAVTWSSRLRVSTSNGIANAPASE